MWKEASTGKSDNEPDRCALDTNVRLQTVVDSLQDELLVIDQEYHILFANRALLSRLGRKSDEVIGNRCYAISHGFESPCHTSDHVCPLVKVRETGNPVTTMHQHVTDSRDSEDTRFFSITASPIKDSTGSVIAVAELMSDVTDARRLEVKMAQAYRTLSTLSSIASVVSQSLDLDTVLQNSLDKVMEIMKTDTGGILLLDEEKQMLCFRAHRGFSSDYLQKVCYPLNEDIDGEVFQTGEAILSDDVLSDARIHGSALVAAEGLKAFASVPLRVKGKVLGVINVASRGPHKFSPEDIQLLNSVAPQIAMAVENAKLHHEVQQKEQMRGELLKEIFSIQEEERRRIARELHDETSQSLASLAASLEVALRLLPPEAAKAGVEIKKMQALSLNILGEIHKLIYELRPTLLDDLGLVAAVRWLASNVLGAEGVSCDFRTTGRSKRLPGNSEASLFRVIQETISNIARHSHAKNASLRIDFRRNSIGVHISDDGCGFDVAEALTSKERPRGLGLIGMRERIEFMGGTLQIDSSPGAHGTRIEIEIPVVCQIPGKSVTSYG